MNVDSILQYKSDPNEDYYAILGCDESATVEQILVEYKIRAKSCHPDKNSHDPESQERFQRLLQVGLITYCVYIIEHKLIEYLVLRKVLLIRPLIDAVSTYLIQKNGFALCSNKCRNYVSFVFSHKMVGFSLGHNIGR